MTFPFLIHSSFSVAKIAMFSAFSTLIRLGNHHIYVKQGSLYPHKWNRVCCFINIWHKFPSKWEDEQSLGIKRCRPKNIYLFLYSSLLLAPICELI